MTKTAQSPGRVTVSEAASALPHSTAELPPPGARNLKEYIPKFMTATSSPNLGQIHALLAEAGYEVSEPGPDTLRVREVQSGVAIQTVLQGEILLFSLACTVVPQAKITPDVMAAMLAADNGIATSYFKIYDTGDGMVAVTLNNFCKARGLDPDEQDDILSCVHFLLQDVMSARQLLKGIES